MAWGEDWLLTARETLPRIYRLWSQLTPTFELPSIASIDEAFICEHGIRGIIWDVDGTLMPRHGTAVAPHCADSFRRLMSLPDLRHVILSNCGEERYLQLGKMFPDVPVLRGYGTASGALFRRLLRGEDSLGEAELRALLGGGARQLRKPNVALVNFAVGELACEQRDSVVAVGDQYFTDVAGANLAGIRSIKVPTLARGSFPLAIRQLQRLEVYAHRLRAFGGHRRRQRETALL